MDGELLFDLAEDDDGGSALGDDEDVAFDWEVDDVDPIIGSSFADGSALIASEVAGANHDCLTVLSPGIDAIALIAECIRRAGTTPNDLVLVFNLQPLEEAALQRRLGSRLPLCKVTSSTMTVAARQRVYIEGRILSIKLDMASCDLIQGILAGPIVKGAIFVNAHRIIPGSKEALVLKLLADNDKGYRPFIKLFTSSPTSLGNNFGRLEKIVACSGVGHVHLWPRFRAPLKAILARCPIDDDVIVLSLTAMQVEIQAAIKDVLQICLSEFQSVSKRLLTDMDDEPLTVESSLGRNISSFFQRKLRPIWHRVGAKSKQMLGDLALLHKLQEMLDSDCVSFLQFLRSVQITPRAQHTQWLMTTPADRLFKLAKRRVYSVHAGKMRVNLEPNPKWGMLRQVLDEIASETFGAPGVVLVVCRDSNSCAMLQEYLDVGAATFLDRRWIRYLKSCRFDGKPDDAADAALGEEGSLPEDAFAAKRVERKLLHREYHRLLYEPKPLSVDASTVTAPAPAIPSAVSKSTRSAPKRPALRQPTLADIGVCASAPKAVVKKRTARKKAKVDGPAAPAAASASSEKTLAGVLATLTAEAIGVPAVPLEAQVEQQYVMLWPKGRDAIPLETIKPDYVVIYDTDITVLREMEMYNATRRQPEAPLRVYSFEHEESIEIETLAARVRRETASFESLAHQKSRMVITTAPGPVIRIPTISGSSSRRGGGSLVVVEQQPIVIVDQREFRSALPGVLYERGVKVVPVTLEVGDYILTPQICIERKSYTDLVQSLRSGRLYDQLTSMKRFYAHPFLLIEFQEDQSFSMHQGDSRSLEGWGDTAVCSKIALLCIYFPEVRFIWSRGPPVTASIFARLKANSPQPDVETAAMIARIDGSDGHLASDILRRLPGVTPGNINALTHRATCIADLVRFDRATLIATMGASSANKFADFLAADLGASSSM